MLKDAIISTSSGCGAGWLLTFGALGSYSDGVRPLGVRRGKSGSLLLSSKAAARFMGFGMMAMAGGVS